MDHVISGTGKHFWRSQKIQEMVLRDQPTSQDSASDLVLVPGSFDSCCRHVPLIDKGVLLSLTIASMPFYAIQAPSALFPSLTQVAAIRTIQIVEIVELFELLQL